MTPLLEPMRKHPTEVRQKKTRILSESAGGVVFRSTPRGFCFALIQDGYRRWTFPKGKLESGETPARAALAEISEELGITQCRIIRSLGSIVIRVRSRFERPYPFSKRVHFFLVETNQVKLTPEPKSISVRDAQWFSQAEAGTCLGYRNSKQIFYKAVSFLTGSRRRKHNRLGHRLVCSRRP